ncbi:MAG: 5'/3'-nucleotidase SurE [Pirellulales bacterium]|nr:5'/3'-nucleotidase SurE [Pirellulales bacterium]
MRILLTNDDGIYAPGLAALEAELSSWANVHIIAPKTEQSGVGHAITFLTPLVAEEVYQGEHRRGWAVEGSPADCVKLGVSELFGGRPDMVISGINSGLNAGINVLYSGTVAAAIEGAFFGIRSVAVSLEYDEHADYASAAKIAVPLIRKLWELREETDTKLFNLNIPQQALTQASPALQVVPMGLDRWGESFERREDPRGRPYYWATNDPPPKMTERETDLSALRRGCVTLTPLSYDMTRHHELDKMNGWKLETS